MQQVGWETHYIAQSRCTSIQKDSLSELSKKQLVRGGWASPEDYPLIDVFLGQGKWLFVRAGRNLIKGRVMFLPIDVAVWAGALWIATSETLNRGGPQRR
jgi:hypothetical protein